MPINLYRYCKSVTECEEPARVETLLVKIGHKKRKDVSSPIMQVSNKLTFSFNPSNVIKSFSNFKSSVVTADVSINPPDDTLRKVPTVSITTEDLSLRNGQQVPATLFSSYYYLLVHCYFC